MALDLDELTRRLGRVGKVLRAIAQFRAAGLGSDVEALVAEYDTLRDVAAPVTVQAPASKALAGDLVPTLAQAARATVTRAVRADQSARSWTDDEAAAELVRQFREQGATVPECATGLTVTALAPFAGDGLLITTTKGGGTEVVAGAALENLFGETLWLTCSQDALTGGATRGRELFRLRGGVPQADVWMDDWPAGSGADASVTAAAPGTNADGNLLTNSGFDAFTAHAPDAWVIEAGAAGATISDTTAQQYAGTAALALAGSATLASIYQRFGTDTAGVLLPLTRYAVAVRLKASATPATGTLVLEVVDDSSTVVNDPQGVPLRTTIALTGLTTSYAATTAVWVTPRALPVAPQFRLRVGTAIETGKTVYVDALCLVPMTEAYPGGPAVAVISGAVPFVAGDGWTLDVENDRAGADFGSTWQTLFDRLFRARTLGLQLPSAAVGATYGDERITD